MTLNEFIEENKEEIDEYIWRFAPDTKITKKVREEEATNDYGLRLWAEEQGVVFDSPRKARDKGGDPDARNGQE